MAQTPFLFAAFAVTWLGIFLYLWTLQRRVHRLTDELAALDRRTPGAE
jgi:CcmD family protein